MHTLNQMGSWGKILNNTNKSQEEAIWWQNWNSDFWGCILSGFTQKINYLRKAPYWHHQIHCKGFVMTMHHQNSCSRCPPGKRAWSWPSPCQWCLVDCAPPIISYPQQSKQHMIFLLKLGSPFISYWSFYKRQTQKLIKSHSTIWGECEILCIEMSTFFTHYICIVHSTSIFLQNAT